MYIVVWVDGYYRAAVNTKGKPDKYGTPKKFKRELDAENWIAKHNYSGMSFHYEVQEVIR